MVAEEQPWVWDMVNRALGAPRRHSGGYRHTRSAALSGDAGGASRAPLAGDGRGTRTTARTLPTNAASRALDGLSSELSQNSELSSDATENWKSPAEQRRR